MRKIIYLVLILLPLAGWAQVAPQQPEVPQDSVKPKPKDSLNINIVEPDFDDSDYWRDTLIKRRERLLRDGEIDPRDRVAKPPKFRKKFRLQYSDRIQYPLTGGFPMSSSAGSNSMVTLERFLSNAEDSLLPNSWTPDTTLKQYRGSIAWRFAKMWLIDDLLLQVISGIDQTFMGQNLRAIEFGYSDFGMNIRAPLPVPFSKSFLYSAQTPQDFYNPLSLQQSAMMISARMETDRIASGVIQQRWMQRGTMRYHEALHFLRRQAQLTYNVFNMRDEVRPDEPMDYWLNYINRQHGYVSAYNLNSGDIKVRHALATFTNVNLYSSLYSVFYNYLVQGKDTMNLPAFRFGYGGKYLPWVSYNLTPFGGEWVIDNTVAIHRRMFNAYVRVGTGEFGEIAGGGIRLTNIIRNQKVAVNAHFAYWYQPYFFRNYLNEQSEAIGEGFGMFVSGAYKLTKKWDYAMALNAQIGFKTRGYLEGEYWGAGPVVRVGLTFNLDNDRENESAVDEYEQVPRRSEIKREAALKKKQRKKNKSKSKFKR